MFCILPAVATLAALLALAASKEACCNAEPRKVVAKGVAYAEVAQNFTLVKLNFRTDSFSAFEAQANYTVSQNAAVAFLESQGERVMNIQSTGGRLQPEYNYNYNETTRQSVRTFEGYSMRGTVSFEVEVVSVDVLDGVLNVGGATVGQIQKKEDYDDLIKAQKKAIQNAVYNARTNGEAMLAGIGETLGKAVYVKSSANDYLSNGGGSLQVLRAQADVTFMIVD